MLLLWCNVRKVAFAQTRGGNMSVEAPREGIDILTRRNKGGAVRTYM